jgi:Ser/Thr protein kinase RdoA (MazF antagonist)
LSRYPITVSRLRFLAAHTNVTYRVDTEDGRVFALRVGSTLEDTDVDVASEMAWLSALVRESDVPVVRPVENAEGELVTVAVGAGVPEERRCVLFSWLPGSVLADRISTARYEDLGELAAQLHDHGERWRPPRTFRPLVWERVFYYSTEPVVLFEPRYRRWMTPERTDIVRRAIEIITPELGRLHRERCPRVIHGDLQMGNVMVHRGRLTAFDFEDVMRGAPVQDIAITLSYGRARPDYGELRRAFRAGYERRRGWPVDFEGQLELLMAARKVMFLNYLLRTETKPEDFVAASISDVGRLVRGVSIPSRLTPASPMIRGARASDQRRHGRAPPELGSRPMRS